RSPSHLIKDLRLIKEEEGEELLNVETTQHNNLKANREATAEKVPSVIPKVNSDGTAHLVPPPSLNSSVDQTKILLKHRGQKVQTPSFLIT
uniref:Uncharacterized protein n=1 Tax=Gasterosteus aculeatus TaxID=69293 RepID=G3N4N0_GASAC